MLVGMDENTGASREDEVEAAVDVEWAWKIVLSGDTTIEMGVVFCTSKAFSIEAVEELSCDPDSVC